MKALSVVLLLFAQVASSKAPDGVDRYIDAFVREHGFSGTILAQQDGEVRYARSFGEADRAFAVPNTRETRYWIASVTKLFTATMVLQLAQEGRIDVAKPAGFYLPDLRGEAASGATVHQLLNHTSGIANFDTVTDVQVALRDGIPYYQLPATTRQLVDRQCGGPPATASGTRFDYNNCDYLVLTLLIETLDGVPYAQALQRRILDPAGLRDTGLLAHAQVVPRLARSYMRFDAEGALANDMPVYPENWAGAGGMYSTADDVLAFADALFDGTLLQRASLDRLLAPGLDEYGYGAWSFETTIGGKPMRVLKRTGGIMGARSQLYRLVDSGTTVVILGNTTDGDLDRFVAEIAKRLGH